MNKDNVKLLFRKIHNKYIVNYSRMLDEDTFLRNASTNRLFENKRIYKVPLSHIKTSRLLVAWVNSLKDASHVEDVRKRISHNVFGFQPTCVADVLGIEPSKSWHALSALHTVYPWETISPDAIHLRRREMMANEVLEHGLKGRLDDTDWKGFGPASEKLLDLESQRLYRVFCSIKEEGFLRRYGVIRARVFEAEGTVLIRCGWHRVAALIACGYNWVPGLFERGCEVVRRGDVKDWGNVKNGLFSVREALEIFDRDFFSITRHLP